MNALRRSQQDIKTPPRDDLARVDFIDGSAKVSYPRMIQSVGLDRGLPVIDCRQFDLEAKFCRSAEQPSRRPAGAAIEVDRANDSLPHRGLCLHFSRPSTCNGSLNRLGV